MTADGWAPIDGPGAAFAVLAALAIPVVLVGAGDGAERSCSTGTLTYVSFDPPMVATPLAGSSRTLELAHRTGELSISVLAAAEVSRAAGAGRRATTTDKFAELGIPIRSDVPPALAPAPADSLGTLWCSLSEELPLGDHILCIGLVHHAAAGGDGTPLVRHGGRYHDIGRELASSDDPPYPL